MRGSDHCSVRTMSNDVRRCWKRRRMHDTSLCSRLSFQSQIEIALQWSASFPLRLFGRRSADKKWPVRICGRL